VLTIRMFKTDMSAKKKKKQQNTLQQHLFWQKSTVMINVSPWHEQIKEYIHVHIWTYELKSIQTLLKSSERFSTNWETGYKTKKLIFL
jgi:hypothetical protein